MASSPVDDGPAPTAPSVTTTMPATTLPPPTLAPPDTLVVAVGGEHMAEVPGPLIINRTDLTTGINAWGDFEIETSEVTDLIEGQAVTITGQGYEPGITLLAGQCNTTDLANLQVPADCSISNYLQVDVADDGSFAFAIVVERWVQDVDCAAATCVVGASPITEAENVLGLDINRGVGTEIAFARD